MSDCEWLPYEAALERVRYRGLKDGLRSVAEERHGAGATSLVTAGWEH